MLPGIPPLFFGSLISFVVSITTNQTEYNLHSVLLAAPFHWDGITRCRVTVNISAGVILGSTNRSSTTASDPIGSFNIGASFPIGSEIDLNIGSGAVIEGYGGNGGAGGGQLGSFGGHAIVLPANLHALLKINNLGDIWGGGGGGAAPGGVFGGGGGGGGAGTAAGVGGAPQSSLVSFGAGSGGNGSQGAAGGAGACAPPGGGGVTNSGIAGTGGNPGVAGGNANSGNAGGPAGHAILLNGNPSPTFTATGNIAGSIS